MTAAPPNANAGMNTTLIHSGRTHEMHHGFVNPPISRGSTVLFETADDFLTNRKRYTYGRRGNPTTDALSSAMCALEGGAGVALVPSGLCAITTALISVLESGDHVLVPDSAYLPTRHFCNNTLSRMGIRTTYYDPLIGGGIAALMEERTRAVFTESPGSLTFEIQDVPAIAQAAHARGACVIMDNTWSTPLYFPAHAHGVDISLQAGTKYLAGHSDVMIGTISATAEWWPRVIATHGNLGLCASPDDAWLALRGLRTMGVRLAHHQKAGLEIARWLQGRPEVARVLHPALPGDPGHALWQRDFTGASGLFAIELNPVHMDAVKALLDSLTLFGMGYSWGGFESLIIPFDATPIRTATEWSPAGPTLRLHIGLEDVDDLIRDLEQGLARLGWSAG